MEISKFAELEQKIKKIVSEQIFLKKQISALEDTLKDKETEIEDFRNKFKILEEERSSVHTRVDSLLDLLADIEVEK